MASAVTNKSNEDQIRALLDHWVDATRFARNDDVLSNHVPNALIFDVLAPLKYEGTEAYRKSWEQWQPTHELPSLFELHELKITASDDAGFAHCLIKCGGTMPTGKTVEDWVRATLCFQKLEGKWKIVHQHISMPR